MLKFKKIFLPIALIVFISQPLQTVSAQVLISEVKIGDNTSARKEFIEIYNDGSEDVDITNWCVNYMASSLISYKLSCFTPLEDNIHLFLPAQNFALAVSSELKNDLISPMSGDIVFSARLSGLAGYVSLVDDYYKQIDDIGWGQADINNSLLSPPTDNLIFKRKMNQDSFMQDTNIYRDDFEYSVTKTDYSIGNIYELADLCSNINGVQDTVPDGYESLNSECHPIIFDICPNLDGVQEVVPVNFILDGESNCIDLDLCPNLPDVQAVIPDNYFLNGGNCYQKSLPVHITEIFPNAVGSDDDVEFIELYNPNSTTLNLKNYRININEKYYDISKADLYIEPNAYLAFYNEDINFSLLNSSSKVFINSSDGAYISETIEYSGPTEGESWSYMEGLWQYTNQPTPNQQNKLSIIKPQIVRENVLQTCGAGQYRSPETNRCRNIVSSSAAILKPCETGYERNPDTNRCRKVASVLGDSNLKPCEPGYERNPDTNRCRKMINQSMPLAGYEVESASGQSDNKVLITSIAGVGTMALGYGLWEWRKDFIKLFKKITNFVHINK